MAVIEASLAEITAAIVMWKFRVDPLRPDAKQGVIPNHLHATEKQRKPACVRSEFLLLKTQRDTVVNQTGSRYANKYNRQQCADQDFAWKFYRDSKKTCNRTQPDTPCETQDQRDSDKAHRQETPTSQRHHGRNRCAPDEQLLAAEGHPVAHETGDAAQNRRVIRQMFGRNKSNVGDRELNDSHEGCTRR